jgi:hypothetical protein
MGAALPWGIASMPRSSSFKTVESIVGGTFLDFSDAEEELKPALRAFGGAVRNLLAWRWRQDRLCHAPARREDAVFEQHHHPDACPDACP